MLRRSLDRATLALSGLALAAAAAIVLVGGFRGDLLGLRISARSADRPLIVFSVLFLLRAWWPLAGVSPERRALRFLDAGWRGKFRPTGPGVPGLAMGAAGFLAGLALWASLGGAVGLAEGAGMAVGHGYLLHGAGSLLVLLGLACGVTAAGALALAPAAILLAGLLAGRDDGPGGERSGRLDRAVRLSPALFPLAATLALAGERPVWSLPGAGSGGLAALLAGGASLAGLAAGLILFGRLLPAGLRAAAARPLVGLPVLAIAGAGAWLAVTGGEGLPSPGRPASRAGAGGSPNILMISVDTLRADRLGCYGSPRVRTPHMDALAARGVRFDQAVCQIPETGPSHASMLNGCQPQTHGSRANGQHPEARPALPDLLREQGYRTAAFVSGYTLKARLSGLDRGFDLYDDAFSPLEPLPGLTLVSRLEEWGVVSYVSLWKIWAERRADATNRAVLRWLRGTAGETAPFFMLVHYFDPHGPYDPPAPFSRMYYDGDETDPANDSMSHVSIRHRYQEKPGVTDVAFYVAEYDAEVTWTDDRIGALLGEIEALGLADRTLVLLTADHGESLTEHGYHFAHGGDLFEPSVRVPLIVAGPGVVAGRVARDQVQSVDIAPSLLELLGLPPIVCDGRSFAGTLKGGPEPSAGLDPGRLAAILEAQDEGREEGEAAVGAWEEALPEAYMEGEVTHERRGESYDDPVAGKERAVRWAGFKLVLTPGFGESLYDLAGDPGETTDVAHFHPGVAARLSRRLSAWIAAAAPAAPSEPLPESERKRLESLGYVGR